MSPNLYIIAGPNGAGKTTFAREFLPQYADCRNFANADLIAQGVSPFAPAAAAFRAGRLMLEEIELMARRGEDFGFETTLAGKTHLKLIRDLKRRGYAVHLFFLWVPTVELVLSRVRGRVMLGGHDVPAEIIRRRFQRSMVNFFRNYGVLAESWILFENSGAIPVVVARKEHGNVDVVQGQLYDGIIGQYGRMR